jgi:taurine dioxygenase
MTQPRATDIIPAFGAEITEVDLDDITEDDAAFLRGAFDERDLLLFRDIPLNRVAQYRLSQLLRGLPVPTDEEAAAGAKVQEHFYISNKRENSVAPFGRLLFHADSMWFDQPFEVLSLHAVDVAPPVPPTTFVSCTYAWDTLPTELRDRVKGLSAVHVAGTDDFPERRRAQYADVMQTRRDNTPRFELSIPRRNERTGATVLNVAEYHTCEVVGLADDESDALLDELFAHLYREDVVYQHEWRQGDLVIWDNVALQHGRPNVSVEGSTRTLAKMGLPLPESQMATDVKNYELAK